MSTIPPRPKSAPSRLHSPIIQHKWKSYKQIIASPQTHTQKSSIPTITTSKLTNTNFKNQLALRHNNTSLLFHLLNKKTCSSLNKDKPSSRPAPPHNTPSSSSPLISSLTHLHSHAIEKWLQSTHRFPPQRYTLAEKRILRSLFCQIDRDSSGDISVQELADPLLSGGIVGTMSQVRHLVRMVDTDESGEICFEEFLSVMRPGVAARSSSSSSNDRRGVVGIDDNKKQRQQQQQPSSKIEQNPIRILQTISHENGDIDIKSVLMVKRRELLIDATMGEMKRREVVLDDLMRGQSFIRGVEARIVQRDLEERNAEKQEFILAIRSIVEREISMDGEMLLTTGGGREETVGSSTTTMKDETNDVTNLNKKADVVRYFVKPCDNTKK